MHLRAALSVFAVGSCAAIALAAAAQSAAQSPEKPPPGAPAELYRLAVPPAKAPTPEAVHLGEKLFREKRLSADGTIACATCHVPEKGFVDHKIVSEGVQGKKGTRNAPSVLNALFNETQFWDGRAPTLEEQAKLPVLNPVEMAMKSPADVMARALAIPEYRDGLARLYHHDPPTYDDLVSAIAAFERTQVAGVSPFDRYLKGDERAISESARRGWTLFNGKGRCLSCHSFGGVAPIFSDQKFHNIGIAAHVQNFASLAHRAAAIVEVGNEKQIDELALQTEFSELGRFLVTRQTNDIGAFKTPQLRDVLVTAPYMHDGTLATLWDVMDHYNKGGVPNPYLDGGMQRLGLSEREIDDLVAFLASLTDDRYAAYGAQELKRQRALSRTSRPQRDEAVALGRKGDMGDLAPNPTRKDPATLGTLAPLGYGGTR